MIEVRSLTKRFGRTVAVEDLSFEARPGSVTGFLGPNGAGKTTTLRALLGLIRPNSGSATIDGVAYADLAEPARDVGAVLEASDFHPGRSGRNHLRVLATAAGVPRSRVEEVLELVELEQAAGRRVKGYSLGMRQRLAIAAALLGDPGVLILDEPANGLDPQGIRWIRDFMRARAGEGRTVLVSSHVLAEIAQTVDEVVVIHRGRLRAQGKVEELTSGAGGAISLRSPEVDRLAAALRSRGMQVEASGGDAIVVRGIDVNAVGQAIAEEGVVIHEMVERRASLEDVFLDLTEGEARGVGA